MREFGLVPRCESCRFFVGEDSDGIGGCRLDDYKPRRRTEQCDLCHTDIRREDLMKGLHDLQRWRRGAKIKMPLPHVIGVLIDAAIHRLRQN